MNVTTCSCLGENEYCYRCDGKGYIENNNYSWPGNTLNLIENHPTPKKNCDPKEILDMPISYILSRDSKGVLIRQEKSQSPKVMKIKQEQASYNFILCQYCSRSIEKNKIIKHKERYHKEAYFFEKLSYEKNCGKLSIKPAVVKYKKNAANTICRICKKTLKKKNLLKHMKKCHSVTYQADESISPLNQNVNANIAIMSSNGQDSAFIEKFDCGNFDKLDFTKSYTYIFREKGRYGSHPVHDDYDEIDNY